MNRYQMLSLINVPHDAISSQNPMSHVILILYFIIVVSACKLQPEATVKYQNVSIEKGVGNKIIDIILILMQFLFIFYCKIHLWGLFCHKDSLMTLTYNNRIEFLFFLVS